MKANLLAACLVAACGVSQAQDRATAAQAWARDRLVQYVDDSHRAEWFSVDRACGRGGPLGASSPLPRDACVAIVGQRLEEIQSRKEAPSRPPSQPGQEQSATPGLDSTPSYQSTRRAPVESRNFVTLHKAESGLCNVWQPSLEDQGKVFLLPGRVSLIESERDSVASLAMDGSADHLMGALAAMTCNRTNGQTSFVIRRTSSTKVASGYRHAAGGTFTAVARHAGLATYTTALGGARNLPVFELIFIGTQAD